MSEEVKPRRSRRAWPEPLDLDKPRYPEESPRQRMLPWVIVYTAIVLLLVCVALIFVYILGRGHARDVENRETQRQTRELIRQGMCDLLDQLPASAVLDGPRRKYGCGPGIPVDQLPPSVRQQWSPPVVSPRRVTTPPETAAATAVPAPTPASPEGATAAPTTTAGVPPPTRPSSAPPPTPSPTDPLLCRLVPLACGKTPLSP